MGRRHIPEDSAAMLKTYASAPVGTLRALVQMHENPGYKASDSRHKRNVHYRRQHLPGLNLNNLWHMPPPDMNITYLYRKSSSDKA